MQQNILLTERMTIRMPKRTCTFCKNHGDHIPKKGHHCPNQNCNCLLCKLTKKAHVAMKHQQRLWRHQKQNLISQKFEIDELPGAGSECKPKKIQACDKCRNHNIMKMKRNHQDCPYQKCQCEFCSLTFKRREIMKYQQMVQRSRIRSQAESDGGPSAGDEPEEEEGEYSYFQEEVSENLSVKKMDVDEPNDYHDIGIANSQVATGSFRDIQLDEDELKVDEMPSNNYSLKSSSHESEHFYPKMRFSAAEENYSSQRQDEEDDQTRESPPPLIHMISDKSPSYHSFSKKNDSASSTTLYNHDSLLASPTRDCSSRHENASPLPSSQFESLNEKPKDDFQSSLLLFQRGSSASMLSFPFPSPQSLERWTALNVPLDPTLKFGSSFDAFRFCNYGFMPSTFLGSSFRNISPTTSSLLRPHYHYQQLECTQTNQPIRPLPVKFSHPRSPGNFTQHLWNKMFLPFNFEMNQNASESNLMKF